jgi:hypothetical protein
MSRKTVILVAGLFFASVPALCQERVLFDFKGDAGAQPRGGLVADSSGNLYGTPSRQDNPNEDF